MDNGGYTVCGVYGGSSEGDGLRQGEGVAVKVEWSTVVAPVYADFVGKPWESTYPRLMEGYYAAVRSIGGVGLQGGSEGVGCNRVVSRFVSGSRGGISVPLVEGTVEGAGVSVGERRGESWLELHDVDAAESGTRGSTDSGLGINSSGGDDLKVACVGANTLRNRQWRADAKLRKQRKQGRGVWNMPEELRGSWIEKKKAENELDAVRARRALENDEPVKETKEGCGAGDPRLPWSRRPAKSGSELDETWVAKAIRENKLAARKAELDLQRLDKRAAEGEIDRQVAIEKRFQEKQLDGSISLQPSRYVSGWAKTVRSQSSKGSTSKSLGLRSSVSSGTALSGADGFGSSGSGSSAGSGGSGLSSADAAILSALEDKIKKLEMENVDIKKKKKEEISRIEVNRKVLERENRRLRDENMALVNNGDGYY